MAYEEICPKCGAVIVLNEIAMRKRLDRMADHIVNGPAKTKKTGNLMIDETFEVECCVLRRTEKAILVEIEDLDEEIWIPKSQIDEWDESKKNNEISSIFIPLWLAKEKRLFTS